MTTTERYVEIASGHITNRGRADKVSNLPGLIGDTKDLHELYHSWYSFDEDIKRHLNGKNSISSFKGVYYLDRIILDIDRKNMAGVDFLSFVRFFVNTELKDDLSIKDEHIQVWFSGTGFHVIIPNLFGFTPSVTLPFSVKSTLQDVFPDCDIIYDGSRLIRAAFSYNKKSGLFKVPLTIMQLNTMNFEEIEKYASSIPSKIDLTQYEFSDVTPYLKQHLKLKSNKLIQAATTKRSAFDIDPTTVVTCMQSVLSRSPIPGETNDSMMRLAAWMRRNGLPQEVVIQTLAQWSGNEQEAVSTTKSEFEKGYNAGGVHKESSDINGRILAMAMKQGNNVIYPTTGREAGKLKGIIDNAEKKGYNVKVNLVTADRSVLLLRNLGRMLKTNRVVDGDKLLTEEIVNGIEETYNNLDEKYKRGKIDTTPKK